MKKVELLAPAGSLEGFYGAVHAGADAVYIGGRKYGARAYAENFSDEQVCLAIRYAHLFGRKLYLTVNTLVKEAEIHDIVRDLTPFYEEGLDGVIIQDMGVFSLLRKAFPGLKLHGSTQMTVTGERGARLLLENGAARVVPARELSLKEIKKIKETGIEVEAFVHGAMCYCYSGQCLFSSLLGGRSGNRGRCAGPCRLPYEMADDFGLRKSKKREQYPLSLKDMCTLPMLPELLQAGIDSFKIEGRMKKPEYCAGVTALYRKYIDLYYENPEGDFQVEKEDMENLKKLYIRSKLQEGYYHRHNGREMITLDSPGYAGADDAYIRQIRKTYLEKRLQIPICGEIRIKKGKQTAIKVWFSEEKEKKEEAVYVEGAVAEPAKQHPITEEDVRKQLNKTGNTPFVFADIRTFIDGDCFITIKAINDLRRIALERLEDTVQKKSCKKQEENDIAVLQGDSEEFFSVNQREQSGMENKEYRPYLAVQADTAEQLEAVSGCKAVERLYLDAGLFAKKPETETIIREWKKETEGRKVFLVLPWIVRLRDESFMTEMSEIIKKNRLFDGCLVRNLESLQWLKEISYRGEKLLDGGLYVWNKEAALFFEKYGVRMTAPLECNRKEWEELGLADKEVMVYGRFPLMISANCIKKTLDTCLVESSVGTEKDFYFLKDRYQTLFPVRTDCRHCYNVIYNSVPLSLHTCSKTIMGLKPAGIRLTFTTETLEETRKVLACYKDFRDGFADKEKGRAYFPESSYTKGHFKRGVE